MKFKPKEKPLVICNYRIAWLLFFIPFHIVWLLFYLFAMIIVWNQFSTVFAFAMFLLLIWGQFGIIGRLSIYKIYLEGILIQGIGFSQILSWSEITYIHESKLGAGSVFRHMVFGSKTLPWYRGILGFSLRHLCPRLRFDYLSHRNYDEACKIILQNVEVVKADAKQQSCT